MTIFWQYFANPDFFVLLLLLPVLWYFELKNRKFWIKFKELDILKKAFKKNDFIKYIDIVLKSLICILFVIIIANPGSFNIETEDSRNGIDISLVMDISKSMLAEDMKPSRIEAAKKVISDFLWKISWDRLSMVIFAGKPFSSIPMTFDYGIFKEMISNIDTDSINQNIPWLSGTAIWDAILQAINVLEAKKEEGQKREKIIILITDGEANMWIDPKIATKYAKEKWIKIYAIWIWDPAGTELFITDNFWNKQYFRDMNGQPIRANLDEKMLKYITNETWGEYYLAKDANKLQEIFDNLAKLNKSEIKVNIIKSFDYDNLKYIYALLFITWFYMMFLIIYKTVK